MQLECEELVVLNWIELFLKYRHPRKFEIKNETFFVINYNVLLKELPILKISKQTLSKHIIRKLIDRKILKRKVLQGDFGTLVAFNFGDNYKLLN